MSLSYDQALDQLASLRQSGTREPGSDPGFHPAFPLLHEQQDFPFSPQPFLRFFPGGHRGYEIENGPGLFSSISLTCLSFFYWCIDAEIDLGIDVVPFGLLR